MMGVAMSRDGWEDNYERLEGVRVEGVRVDESNLLNGAGLVEVKL